MELRPYQGQIVDEASAAFRAGHRRVCVQLPTGGGKGRILQRTAGGAFRKRRRVVIGAHRAELVDQIASNLDDEDIPYGRIQPGWPMMNYPVQIGMIQTIARRLDKLNEPNFFLIDEAHHAVAGLYRRITSAWQRAWILGVTATPVRTDGNGLHEDFDVLVTGPSTRELIDGQFLADYDYFEPASEFDTSSIGVRAGDFEQASALRMMEKAKIVGDAVGHYRQHLDGRPAIAFCMGVQHTHDVAAEFRAAGIAAAGIDGKMDLDERKRLLAALATGEIRVLTAADVVSEGVDIPQVAGAILLRPTCSLGLYLQQVGRALRRKADGSRAVILDHVGNSRKHGYPADPRHWSLDGVKKIEARPMRTCGKCARVFYASEATARAEAECEQQPCDILAPPDVAERARMPGEVVDGVLSAVADPWAWAGGIDPVRATGPEFKALIKHAATEEQLKMIARARGYHHRWVRHIMRERHEKAAA